MAIEQYFNDHVLASVLQGLALNTSQISSSTNIITAIGSLQGQINALGQGGVPPTRTLSINGDSQDLSKNRFWTVSVDVLGTVLTGYVSGSGIISPTDTVLSAIEKLNGNIAAIPTGVTLVSGTANRITSTGGATPAIDIAATYVGQASITTLGTITTGTWNGTAIGDTYISSASTWNAKLTSVLSSGNMFVGSAGNVATAVAMSGDITISNSGVTAIGALKVTNAMIAATTIDLTAKVTGLLPMANGGTNANLTADNGGIIWSNGTQLQILAHTTTAGLSLVSGNAATPSWYAPTASRVIYAGVGGKLSDDANFTWDATNGLALSKPLVVSFSGIASTPSVKVSGTPFADTGATSFPLFYLNQSAATASSSLNVAGTWFGINSSSNAIDFQNFLVNGSSVASLSGSGLLTITSSLTLRNTLMFGLLVTNSGYGIQPINNNRSFIISTASGDPTRADHGAHITLGSNISNTDDAEFMSIKIYAGGRTSGTQGQVYLQADQNSGASLVLGNNAGGSYVGLGNSVTTVPLSRLYVFGNVSDTNNLLLGRGLRYAAFNLTMSDVAATNPANMTGHSFDAVTFKSTNANSVADIQNVNIAAPIQDVSITGTSNLWALRLGGGLRIDGTTQGVLLPRLTTTQRNALTAIEGLLVYETTVHQLAYYNGTTWINI